MKTIKETKIGKTTYKIAMDEYNTIFVCWNPTEIHAFERAEWLNDTKTDGIFSTLTNWDELDNAVIALGGKVNKNGGGFVSDWGDGDIDVFTRTYYDFRSVFMEC